MGKFSASARTSRWIIRQDFLDWVKTHYWESIFSLANGYIGMRGSFEEPLRDTPIWPLTLMAGLYDTLPELDALPVWPALPEWLNTNITLGGTTYDPRRGQLLNYKRILDMRRGVLLRNVTWKDKEGRITKLCFTRFLSMSNRKLGLVRISIRPVNWSGRLEVEPGLQVWPGEYPHYHWDPSDFSHPAPGCAMVQQRTQEKKTLLVMAGAYRGQVNGQEITPSPATGTNFVGQKFSCEVEAGQWYKFDRCVAFNTVVAGIDAQPVAEQALQMAQAADFETEFAAHKAEWKKLWNQMDVEIAGPKDDQVALRFNMFQLSACCPRGEQIASIGAKCLSSLGYAGHVFWDTEIYMLPFFIYTQPDAARVLCEYRYQTLNGARSKAKRYGYKGAQYAWESAEDGEEACPLFATDRATGQKFRTWWGDIQEHVTSDVAWGCYEYGRVSGDKDFMWHQTAEILFETARFWVSRVKFDDQLGKYGIYDVIGPDEYHVHVHNDAYTNYGAQWNLRTAADMYRNWGGAAGKREKMIQRLGLTDEEVQHWQEVADTMFLPYDPETGIIEQFADFFKMPDIEPGIFRLFRRCGIGALIGGPICEYSQVLKQANVVALHQLFQDQFDQHCKEVNFDYYEARCAHDSSLSAGIHGVAAGRIGRCEQAYHYFRRSAFLDLEDFNGNTHDGLHAANLGGAWQAAILGLGGLSVQNGKVATKSCLPRAWKGLRCRVAVKGKTKVVTIK